MMAAGFVEQYTLYVESAVPNDEPAALSQLIFTVPSNARTETFVHDAVLAVEVAAVKGDESEPPQPERYVATVIATNKNRNATHIFPIESYSSIYKFFITTQVDRLKAEDY
jgi:hypothetical protein